jgi:hypothetical protein
MKLKWTAAAALVLVAAVGLQFRGAFEASQPARSVDLRAALAVEPAGWEAKDLPIGDTEVLREAAASTLRYDEYFYRLYRRGSTEFTVYVAYWKPGKYPPQMIAKHTPDMCWTLNGMTCEEMRFSVSKQISGVELWPGQWRKFRAPSGQINYTIFWHMVGERPFDYGTQFYSIPHPVTFWLESLRFAVGAKSEQFFFRMTSNVPPEDLWNDVGFQQATAGFVTLGLAKPAIPR